MSVIENPHSIVQGLSRDLSIGKSLISNIFKRVKYNSYEERLVHELSEDNFDRKTKFCEYMTDQKYSNNNLIL